MGTVEKKIIYRGRKGFNDVKKYIKTINPDLPDQVIQKGHFKDAIEEWKVGGYSEDDIQAWNSYSRANRIRASGFNMFTKYYIGADVANKTWERLSNCTIYDVVGTGFKVDIDVNGDYSGKLYYGTSNLYMVNEVEGVFSTGKYTFNVTGLSILTRYFFYIKNTAIGKEGRTGIYRQKTTVYTPVDIDIGSPAIDRANALGWDNTFVEKNNPANVTGKILQVQVYAQADMTGAIIAIFEEVEANKLTARDNIVIGNITAGSVQSFDVNLNVVTGDYIGIYFATGILKLDTFGGGNWWHEGDETSCINLAFTFFANRTMSLYGKGKG